MLLTSTIVGGELTLAPGVALSQTMLEKNGIVGCFFGDGAACEGAFHESLNLASPPSGTCRFCTSARTTSGRRSCIGRNHADRSDQRAGAGVRHGGLTVDGNAQGLEQALAEEMRRDPRVLTFGEGVATKRQSLVAEFGAVRVRNTPLAEGIIAGTPSARPPPGSAR